MSSTDPVQSRILQHTSNLLDGIIDNEVWQFVELFQQSHPAVFMHICHRTLSSYLEMAYDYFDHGWPVQTRIEAVGSIPKKPLVMRTGRKRKCTDILSDCSDCEEAESKHPSLILTPSYDNQDPTNKQAVSAEQNPTNWLNALHANNVKSTSNKLRGTFMAKGLFRQLLPSLPREPRANMEIMRDEEEAKNKIFTCFSSPDHRHRSSPLKSTPLKRAKSKMRVLSADTWNAQFVDFDQLLESNRPQIQTLSDGSICPINLNSLICNCLVEYMLQTPGICTTEGLFRIPGSSQRIRELWCELRDHIQSPYVRIMGPDDDLSPRNSSCFSTMTWNLLSQYTPHDLATLLLRTMSACSPNTKSRIMSCRMIRTDEYRLDSVDPADGLVPIPVSELCLLATRLQYDIEKDSDEWITNLCRARQLLTYRIVTQLLLPPPERKLLNDFLQLLNAVSQFSHISRMSAESLARCTFMAIFGLPRMQTKGITRTSHKSNPLKWRIDTMTNLIQCADQLQQIPSVIYEAIRNRLRTHLDHSPMRPNVKYIVKGMPIEKYKVASMSDDSSLDELDKTLKPSQDASTAELIAPVQKTSRKKRSVSVDCSALRSRAATFEVDTFRFWRRKRGSNAKNGDEDGNENQFQKQSNRIPFNKFSNSVSLVNLHKRSNAYSRTQKG